MGATLNGASPQHNKPADAVVMAASQGGGAGRSTPALGLAHEGCAGAAAWPDHGGRGPRPRRADVALVGEVRHL